MSRARAARSLTFNTSRGVRVMCRTWLADSLHLDLERGLDVCDAADGLKPASFDIARQIRGLDSRVVFAHEVLHRHHRVRFPGLLPRLWDGARVEPRVLVGGASNEAEQIRGVKIPLAVPAGRPTERAKAELRAAGEET